MLPALAGQFAAWPLKPEVFNLLLPGDLVVLGPHRDFARQQRYLETAFRRASQLGGQIIVFGSGGARRLPDGLSVSEAHTQMLAFLAACGSAAQRHQMSLAIEPLNRNECNIINSVAEAVALARELGHPAVGVLSDLYHVTHDGQSCAETRDALPWLRHVHVAGLGRRGPCAADFAYLRGFFAVLKEAGYTGRVSIEASWKDLETQAAEAFEVVRGAWEAA